MGKESIIDKIKSLIYFIVKPIYLWSIGCKTLEEYIRNIEKNYELYRGEYNPTEL